MKKDWRTTQSRYNCTGNRQNNRDWHHLQLDILTSDLVGMIKGSQGHHVCWVPITYIHHIHSKSSFWLKFTENTTVVSWVLPFFFDNFWDMQVLILVVFLLWIQDKGHHIMQERHGQNTRSKTCSYLSSKSTKQMGQTSLGFYFKTTSKILPRGIFWLDRAFFDWIRLKPCVNHLHGKTPKTTENARINQKLVFWIFAPVILPVPCRRL